MLLRIIDRIIEQRGFVYMHIFLTLLYTHISCDILRNEMNFLDRMKKGFD